MDILITNSSSSISIQDPFLNVITTITIPIISIIAISLIGALTWQYSKKQHERSALVDVFKIIDDQNHKNAESNLRQFFLRHMLEFPYADADLVRRNYDKIGVLIEAGLVPKKQYYLTFGVITVVSYFILKEYIIEKRKNGQKFHMARFTNLAIDCFIFWDNANHIITDPSESKITRGMLGDKVKIPK